GGFVRALVRNPLIIATAAGLAFNLAGLRMPAFAEPTLLRIGSASIALGLMTAGAGLQFGQMATNKALTTGVLAIRHFLTPLAGKAARTAGSRVARNAFPSPTAMFRSHLSCPIRRMALPSVNRRNSSSVHAKSFTSCAPESPSRSSKSGKALLRANLFHGQTSWQSSQP